MNEELRMLKEALVTDLLTLNGNPLVPYAVKSACANTFRILEILIERGNDDRKQPLSAPEMRSTWASLLELVRLRGEVAQLRRELDWVEVSPAVSGWLRRLGLRPAALQS